MKLSQVLDKLCAIEKTLTVDLPDLGSFQILNAWPGHPAMGVPLEVPCFMHFWALDPLNLASQGPNGFRQQHYSVHIQVPVGPTSPHGDLMSRIATAFHEAFIDALAANVQLEDAQTQIDNLRSAGQETLTVIEWEPNRYVGLDYLLDVTVVDVVTMGA
jgi:hypothetical protein